MILSGFFLRVLSSGKGLVGLGQLRRSIDLATIVMAMAVEGIGCGGRTTMALVTHQA